MNSLKDRFAVALVAAVAAFITLLVFPFLLGLEFYLIVFSKIGVLAMVLATVIGFCIGGEKTANMFSFFWGTHEFWSRVNSYLAEKMAPLTTQYFAPKAILLSILFILAIVWVIAIWTGLTWS